MERRTLSSLIVRSIFVLELVIYYFCWLALAYQTMLEFFQMRILIIVIFLIMNTGVFAQKNLLQAELDLSTVSLSANYERFIVPHLSLGAKIGYFSLGAELNYYFKKINYNQCNGHIGIGYEFAGAIPIASFIEGPTMYLGIDRIKANGVFMGLDGGVMATTYYKGYGIQEIKKNIYPMINFKIGKLF